MILKLISAILELGMIILPLLKISLISSLYYLPLLVLLGIHIFSAYLNYNDDDRFLGNTSGIIASIFTIIPVLGLLLHIITEGLLIREIIKEF